MMGASNLSCHRISENCVWLIPLNDTNMTQNWVAKILEYRSVASKVKWLEVVPVWILVLVFEMLAIHILQATANETLGPVNLLTYRSVISKVKSL